MSKEFSFDERPGLVTLQKLPGVAMVNLRRRLTIIMAGAFGLVTLFFTFHSVHPALPNTAIQPTSGQASIPHTQLNSSKIATIIEPRNIPNLLPILHNFLSVLPPDWPILVWGTEDNSAALQSTSSLRPYFSSGRLTFRLLPEEYKQLNGRTLSKLMVTSWFWRQFGDAEHMLTFQTDSVLCSRAEGTVDDWLQYDYVGSPLKWAVNGRGGNGGLSIRRVSSMLRVAEGYEGDLKRLGKSPEYMGANAWRKREDKEHYFTDEDLFFVYKLVDIDEREGDRSTIRWPVQDGRSQSHFSYDIWQRERRPVEEVKSLGFHTGTGFAQRWIQYNGTDFSGLARSWMMYCPELAFLRFVPE